MLFYIPEDPRHDYPHLYFKPFPESRISVDQVKFIVILLMISYFYISHLSWLFNVPTVKLFAMKKTVLLIIFILSFLSATDAQWYNRSCGVIDINNTTSEEFECLWENTTIIIIGGAILTAIGTGFWVLAYIREKYYFKVGDLSGIFTLPAGLIFNTAGMSTIMIGAIRRSELKRTPGYDFMKLGSLNLSPVIGINQFNNTHYLGVSLSLNF